MIFNVQPQSDGFYCVWQNMQYPDANVSVEFRAGDAGNFSALPARQHGRAFVPATDTRAEYQLRLAIEPRDGTRVVSDVVRCPLRRESLADRLLTRRMLPFSTVRRFNSFRRFSKFAARAGEGGLRTLTGAPVDARDPALPNGMYRVKKEAVLLNRAHDRRLLEHHTHRPEMTRHTVRGLLWPRGAAPLEILEAPHDDCLRSALSEEQRLKHRARVLRIACGSDLHSRVVVLQSAAPAGRAAIFHEGHTGSSTREGWPVVSWFLEHGWDVYCMDMLICGRNAVDRRAGLVQHNDLMNLWASEPARTLTLMVDPILAVIDHIAAGAPQGLRLAMSGRSGGGLLAYICAALDDRIGECIAVAAGVPLSQRLEHPTDLGDYEQFLPEFYDYVRHEDLMVCAATRHLLLIYNSRDPDCFALPAWHPLPGYLTREAGRFGGSLDVFIDESNAEHSIGPQGFRAMERFLGEPATTAQ